MTTTFIFLGCVLFAGYLTTCLIYTFAKPFGKFMQWLHKKAPWLCDCGNWD